MNVFKANKIACGVAAFCCLFVASAQTPVGTPAASGPSEGARAVARNLNGQHLEVEVVEVNDFAAVPSKIHRKAGNFYLYLVNRSQFGPLNLVLDSASANPQTTARLASSVRLQALSRAKHVTGVFDGPAGEYQLKIQGTDKVLLTITLE